MNLRRVFYLIAIVFLAGCFQAPVKPTLSEAHQKFIELMKTEHQLDAVILPAPNTVWIYVPIEKPILKMDVKGGPKEADPVPKEKLQINYLKSAAVDKTFAITYDIAKKESYGLDDPGYGLNYTEAYAETYRKVLASIYSIYFDLEELPGDRDFADPAREVQREKLIQSHVKMEKTPEFFVIVIADVTTGIQAHTTMFLEDYKRNALGEMPQEEYSLRVLSKMIGISAAAGNRDGSFLDVKEVTMPWFLAEQIENRIRFKFEKSDFPPKQDTDVEIMTIVANTFRYYDFKDFTNVKLNDLLLDKEMLFEADRVSAFADDSVPVSVSPPLSPRGRIRNPVEIGPTSGETQGL